MTTSSKFSWAIVVLMIVLVTLPAPADDDDVGKVAAKRWLQIRGLAWESFHESIDKNHDKKSENWMDAKDRRELLDKAVQSAIHTATSEGLKWANETNEKPKPPPLPPLPPIAPGSTAWIKYGGEPKQVRVEKGPTEERTYLVRASLVEKQYGGGYGRPISVYEVPTERVVEKYMFVDERSIYFPEKLTR